MKNWNNRPNEIANLLNPAFCSEILLNCISEYNKKSAESFLYPITFLVLPIVLHYNTRNKISPRTRKKMHTWLQINPEVKINFHARAKNLVPITREAILFLLKTNMIKINSDAQIIIYNNKNIKFSHDNYEMNDCYKKARIIGKWFSQAGKSKNIYIMWGVKP